MNNIDKQYQDLLQDILDNGVEKKDRTTTGTISVFGRQIRHKMSDGFPLLTTKKMAWKTMVTELLWFLRGDTNIKFLVDNGCHIWDGDAYKKYFNTVNNDDYIETFVDPKLRDEARKNKGKNGYTKEEFINEIKTDDEFAKTWGELGPIYGKQWRNWGDGIIDFNTGKRTYIDQIANLINDLKTNPDSRRLMVNAWNVGELDQMVLPPCHFSWQCYSHEKDGKRYLSLAWNQRSVDTFLGLPFNIASYGLLLEIIAKAVNMIPDELIGNLGDVHLYSNHVEQAKEQIGRKYTADERTEMLKEAMGYEAYHKAVDELMPFGGGLSEYYDFHKIPHHTREPYPLPTLKINSGNENWHLLTIDEIINSLDVDITFKVDGYQSHPTIKAPLSN